MKLDSSKWCGITKSWQIQSNQFSQLCLSKLAPHTMVGLGSWTNLSLTTRNSISSGSKKLRRGMFLTFYHLSILERITKQDLQLNSPMIFGVCREQKETKERDARIADLEDQVKSLRAANFSVLTTGCMTMLLMKQCCSKIQSVFDTRTVLTGKDFYLFWVTQESDVNSYASSS